MIITEQEYSEADKESVRQYCNDCWFRGYGDCDKCAVEKHRASKPAREESCKTCKHNGNQNIYQSGCTGCGADAEFLHYEPARKES